MQHYTLLSRLLDYPDGDLMKSLTEISDAIRNSGDITGEERETLLGFTAWLAMHDTIAIQEVYVQTFDMTPEHDLHLTHHLFGEDNDRGPALIDLSEHYKLAGLEANEQELPDYLPLILEYLSVLDEVRAQAFLADAGKVLKVLAENLEKAGSPYARLVRIVENRGHTSLAA
jgi:nitrate reductase delta subunit